MSDSVEADTPYAAWSTLKDTAGALQPGDILESDTGDLRIYKYVGFEYVQWQTPEAKAGNDVPGATASESQAQAGNA